MADFTPPSSGGAPDPHGNGSHTETFAADGDAQPPESHGNAAHTENYLTETDGSPSSAIVLPDIQYTTFNKDSPLLSDGTVTDGVQASGGWDTLGTSQIDVTDIPYLSADFDVGRVSDANDGGTYDARVVIQGTGQTSNQDTDSPQDNEPMTFRDCRLDVISLTGQITVEYQVNRRDGSYTRENTLVNRLIHRPYTSGDVQ